MLWCEAVFTLLNWLTHGLTDTDHVDVVVLSSVHTVKLANSSRTDADSVDIVVLSTVKLADLAKLTLTVWMGLCDV